MKVKAGDREVLKRRATELASAPLLEHEDRAVMKVVEFSLAHELYAFESAYVREAHPLDEITPIPGVPPFIAGIMSIRGRIVAVLDIRKFFELPEEGFTDAHKIVLIHSGDLMVGVLADMVIGVREVPLSDLQPTLPHLQGIRQEHLKGVANDRLVILDAKHILSWLSRSQEPDRL